MNKGRYLEQRLELVGCGNELFQLSQGTLSLFSESLANVADSCDQIFAVNHDKPVLLTNRYLHQQQSAEEEHTQPRCGIDPYGRIAAIRSSHPELIHTDDDMVEFLKIDPHPPAM